jgi:hypothetical protein
VGGLFLLVTSGRLGVIVMFGFAMTVTVAFVHAFMENLGFLPTMLGAGRAKGNESGSSEEGEGDFLHEQESEWGWPIVGAFHAGSSLYSPPKRSSWRNPILLLKAEGE